MVAAAKTQDKTTRQDDAVFLSCERRPSLRRGTESATTEELIAAVREGRLKKNGMKELMLAVGLERLPQVCNRVELARCLKTRFDTITAAIPALSFETI